MRGHAQVPPERFRARSPRITTYHHRSPRICGCVVGKGDGGGGGGPQGVPAVVRRGSRACGVTPRTPPRGSAPDHLGSPPITTDHHGFVGGWVGKGDRGGGGGTTGGPRGGEPGVPGVRGHAQVPPERFRTRSPRLTTYHHRSPLFCGYVVGWVRGVGGGGGGYRGSPRWGAEGPGCPGSRSGPPRRDPHPHTSGHHLSPPITTALWVLGGVGTPRKCVCQ